MNRSIRAERGSALVLVIVILTSVVIVCGFVLAGFRMQNQLVRRKLNQIQAMYLAEAGVYKTLSILSTQRNREWRPRNEPVSLFDNRQASVSVDEWGGFLRVTSTAVFQKSAKTVRVLAGEKLPQEFHRAVVLGGVGYPLVVTGKNRIVGDVTVGPRGVEPGWIQGKGFEGTQPVEGNIFRIQKPELPFFDPSLFSRVYEKHHGMVHSPRGRKIGAVLDRETIRQDTSDIMYAESDLSIDFDGESDPVHGPLTIIGARSITIRGNTRLSGWIELAAAEKVIVSGKTVLTNCILFGGDGIDISGNCRVEGQLLSPGDITIRERAFLEYPSIIHNGGWMINEVRTGRILVRDQAVVHGTLIQSPVETQQSSSSDESLIGIEKGAILVGVLYANHVSRIEGTVLGSVASNGFTLFVPPTEYINWLRDACIDRSKLPESYVMPLFFSETPKMEIVKWTMVHDL